MHKTKRPLSFLLAVVMIVSMFAAVPFSASAATLTGTVDMSELQVDDVISNAVTITNNNSYSLKLTSGKIYCESWDDPFYMGVLDHDVVLTSFSFEINEFTDRIYVKDNNARDTTYSPLDKNGDRGGIAFVVSAVDPDTSTVTIESAPAYTVYWKNYNGNTIQEEDLLKGDMPSYSGETPAKPADAQYVYTFSGWAPEIAAVTVNVSYVAQFTASPIPADYASPAISGLWVGDSAEVTATGEISGTGGAGTASVSQEGDYIVLTLNNFSYSGEGGSYDNDNIRSSVVYTGSAPLIVRLIGTNVLTQTGVTSGNSFGFYTDQDADVRVEGPGELTVSSGDAESNSSGMYVSGALIVSGCTLNAAAGDSEYYYASNTGLDVSGDLTVENGANVTAVGGGVVGDNPHSVGAMTFSYYDGCHNVVLKSGSVSLAGDTSAIYYSDASYRSYLEVAPDSTLITLKAGNTEVDTADVTLDDITNQKYIYAEATAKAAELPDAIKDCTYQYSYEDTILAYANVPFKDGGYDQLLTGAISFEGNGTEIALYDAKEYSYTFYTEAGTEIPAESVYSDSGPCSGMFSTSDDFTVYLNVYNLSGFTIGTDVLYIVAEEPAAATPNDQQFVTIDDQISITLALDLGTRGKTTGDVTINREVESVQAADTDGVYNYKIVMAPAQIADEIVVTIGEETLTTSIKGYCETLSGDEYSEYAAAQNLAEAILEYGKAANTVFAYTDAASFAGIGDPDKTAVNAYTGAVFTDSTNAVTGASFMALTKPEFRFYTSGITEAQGYAYNQAGITVEMANASQKQADALNARFVKKADNSVLLEVTGVLAENMDKTVTVTINALGQTITFNGNAFAKAMAKSKNTQQSDLGAALYNYGVAAKRCFGA